MMKKINIGAGEDHREGYISFDIRKETNPDVIGDIHDLPFRDESFDECLMVDVLEHTDEPVEWLKEVHRVLEDGGQLYIRVPDLYKMIDKNFIENTPFFRTENRLLGGRKNRYDQHKSLFTKDILRERLKRAGFGKIKTKELRKKPLHWHLAGYAKK